MGTMDLTGGKAAAFLFVVDEWDTSDIDGTGEPSVLPGDSFLFPREMVASVIDARIGDDTPDADREVADTIGSLLGDGNPDNEAKWRAENVLEAAMDRVCDETGWCILDSHVESPPAT